MSTAVVANRRLDGVRRDGAVVGEQFFQALRLQIRSGFQRLVQVRDVGLVMLAMMDLHGHRVNVRFKCVERVG